MEISNGMRKPRQRTFAVFASLLIAPAAISLMAGSASQQATTSPSSAALSYRLAPAQCKVNFTLHATAHSVHGEFDLTRGEVKLDPATGAVSGEIVVDSRSGRSGNDSRDANMRHDVLEADKFPEITFRPDRITNFDSTRGAFQATIHGTFSIHGVDHELSVPLQISLAGETWTASASFSVPYVDWGMHDPSNFFLHVGRSVDVEIQMAGNYQ